MPDAADDNLHKADFWPHRYDEQTDRIHFLNMPRDVHRACTFVTDEHLPQGLEKTILSRKDAVAGTLPAAPIHFIFHSAYCCSTMLARAFDIPGISMGLKEPQILNDMIGWSRRGAKAEAVNLVTENSLQLLKRPFDGDKAVVIKPSNIVNPIADLILNLEKDAHALLLHAPLEYYLRSIAKKEMWGRLWVRELLIGRLKDGTVIDGFTNDDLLGLSDMQVAALGWLSEHALFGKLLAKYGPERVRSLDSETLLKSPRDHMDRLQAHFQIKLSDTQLDAVMDGPAFGTNSKTGEAFDADDRRADQAKAADLHKSEIDMVAQWAIEVAKFGNIQLKLDAPL